MELMSSTGFLELLGKFAITRSLSSFRFQFVVNYCSFR